MSWVYILKTSSGKYYIGSTADINKRLLHHKGGFTPSTKRLGNPELVFSQEFELLKDARYIESRLKKFKKRVYIDKIIQEGKIRIMPP